MDTPTGAATVSAIASSISALVAIVAAIVAFLVARKTTLRSKRPNVTLINDLTKPQNTRVVPFRDLPENVRTKYPERIGVDNEGAALVRLLFSNGGDADGFIAIDADALRIINHADWRFSLDTQGIVGAKGFLIHDLVLRNLPVIPSEPEVTVALTFSWGGAGATPTEERTDLRVRLFTMPHQDRR